MFNLIYVKCARLSSGRVFGASHVFRRGMSSFSVFALACTLYPRVVHSRLDDSVLHIFLIDDVDGLEVSVSWFFGLVSGVEDLLGPRGLLFMRGVVYDAGI